MKRKFIALSGSGAAALFLVGMVAGWTLAHPDVLGALFIGIGLASVYDDARGGFASGSYARGWWTWRRTASLDTAVDRNRSRIRSIAHPEERA
jgi:hypothetical protein